MFALLNFKAVFGLAFARICVSLLQAVVAFHEMQMRTATEVKERQLESCIFVLAVFKIIACYTVRSSSSQRKWGAISFTEMARRLSIFSFIAHHHVPRQRNAVTPDHSLVSPILTGSVASVGYSCQW